MHELTSPPRLTELGRISLFLDLDGTLAAIRPRPGDVGPEAWRTELLRRLGERLEGRVAVISGRTLEEIDRILGEAVPALAAVHGLIRRRPDGRVIRAEAPASITRARRAVAELAAAHVGLLVEDKGLSLAVHYRLKPELEPLVRVAAEKIARDDGLKLQMGRKVAEICTPGPDKGAALDAFMREPPFAGSRPVFVGDDLTDEDGFAAAEALGGLGVLVGPARETRARLRLEDASAVRSWLETAVMEDARP